MLSDQKLQECHRAELSLYLKFEQSTFGTISTSNTKCKIFLTYTFVFVCYCESGNIGFSNYSTDRISKK